METALIVAIIGVIGTLLASLIPQIIELLRLRLQTQVEDLKETKKIQRNWFREHNIERYAKVKEWIIDATKAVELSPLNQKEVRYSKNLLNELELTVKNINLRKVEVSILASGDEQLLSYLNSFISEFDHAVNLRPEQTYQGESENWYSTESRYKKHKEKIFSLSADIVNRIYELMLQSPKFERIEEIDEIKKERQKRELQKITVWLIVYLVMMFFFLNWIYDNQPIELLKAWLTAK